MNLINYKPGFIEKHTPFIIILIILCQIFTVTIFGIEKESFHLDELYTYGLSNSYFEPFLRGDHVSMTWHSPDFYNNYLTVQGDERFAYNSVYYNQVNDVHPPFYYYCIHTLCSLFPNVFSKWFGIVFNMVFLSGTVIVLYYLSRLIFKDKFLALVICATYGFSAGAISNTVFIRMYMMLTFFTVLTTYLHGLLVLQKRQQVGIVFAIIIANIFGFLTQYLFVVYAFFIACGYEVYLFKQSKWKAMIGYAVAITGSTAVSVALFPECIRIILFGNMGTTVISNLTIIGDYFTKIAFFIWFLSKALFGGPILFAIILTTLIFIMFRNKWSSTKIIKNYFNTFPSLEKWVLFVIIVFTTMLVFLVIVKIAPYYDAHRYIAYIYPNATIIVVLLGYSVICNLVKDKRKVRKILAGIICICTVISYCNGSVDYLFKEKADDLDVTMSKYIDYDAYCVTTNTHNMTIAIPLLSKHNKSCYVSCNTTAKDIINMMTDGGREIEPIVIYFPRWVCEGDPDTDVLNNIIENTEFGSFKQLVTKGKSGLATSIYVLE